jgi:cell division protein FtsL
MTSRRTRHSDHGSKRRGARLRLARPPRPPRSRRLPFLFACFALVGSLVVAVVSVQALVAQNSFRLQELTRTNAELAQASGQMQLEVAQLSAPNRIAREARRLGYQLPDPGQLHTLALRGRP